MKFDIVLWGATSFVGQLVAEYLIKNYYITGQLSIAFAGRDKQKLDDLCANLNVKQLPILVGDAKDESFLTGLTQQTKLVISTVGPYELYGEPLIKACVAQGIDYLDLTGEPQWIWRMLQRYEAQACETGARIMHCCGFDSIPSDLGVLSLQHFAKQQYGETCEQIQYRFGRSKGGFSGGTIASMLTALEQIGKDKSKARALKTPYSLLSNKPEGMPYQKSVKSLTKDPITGQYLVPFVMASINTKVVHRTNELLGFAWGKSFLYDEAMQLGTGVSGWRKGLVFMFGLTAFGLMASFSLTRTLLAKFLLPKPGEGPSEDIIKNGFFNIDLTGQSKKGHNIRLKISGQGDPGYGSTCKMISETAVLLLQTPRTETGVGFITPASGLGLALVERLKQKAQMRFDHSVE